VGYVSDEAIYLLFRLPGGQTLWDKLASLFSGHARRPGALQYREAPGPGREVSVSGQEDFLDFAQWLNERIDYITEFLVIETDPESGEGVVPEAGPLRAGNRRSGSAEQLGAHTHAGKAHHPEAQPG
jgi:hypothetical protein